MLPARATPGVCGACLSSAITLCNHSRSTCSISSLVALLYRVCKVSPASLRGMCWHGIVWSRRCPGTKSISLHSGLGQAEEVAFGHIGESSKIKGGLHPSAKRYPPFSRNSNSRINTVTVCSDLFTSGPHADVVVASSWTPAEKRRASCCLLASPSGTGAKRIPPA